MNRVAAYQLDWSQPVELYRAWNTLDNDQQRRLRNVWRKPKAGDRLRRAFGHKRHRYIPQGSIYALADWDCSDAFCACGYREGNRIISCGQWRFCCWCSYQRRWNALCQFAPHFADAQWRFLTISFAGGIEAEDLSYWPLPKFWDVCRNTVKFLQRTNHVKGGVWREELQVMSFSPLRLRPHLHLIAISSLLTAAEVEAVMRAKFSACLNDLPAPLDVDCRETATNGAFINRLSYMHKELDLLRPYRAAVRRLGPHGDCTRLNKEVGWFLRHFSTATRRRRQTGSTGILHPLSPDYLGTSPDVFRRSPGESGARREGRKRYFDYVGRLVRRHCQADED